MPKGATSVSVVFFLSFPLSTLHTTRKNRRQIFFAYKTWCKRRVFHSNEWWKYALKYACVLNIHFSILCSRHQRGKNHHTSYMTKWPHILHDAIVNSLQLFTWWNVRRADECSTFENGNWNRCPWKWHGKMYLLLAAACVERVNVLGNGL